MNGRIRRIIAAIILATIPVGSALAQTPADTVQPKYTSWWLPDVGTQVAGEIDNMFNVILWVTGIVNILVFAVMIWFMVKYRYNPNRRAHYTHGNNRLEIAWTVAPALILIFLAFFSADVWSDIKQEAPDESTALVVEVRPRQFQWDFRYSGADGQFGTPDDITTINQLHVPVGRDVLVKMTAQDVIHSFFVPEYRVKQDAVPGMTTRIWFKPEKVEKLEIACAELCGLGHYRMRGFLTVHEAADFEKWYGDQQAEKEKQLNPPPVADTAAAPAAPATTDTSATATDTTAATSSSADTAASAPTDTAAGK
jgi:cytochrome c oxidase subunit 2